MKKETEMLLWVWVGITFSIVMGVIANYRIDIHQESYPNIKCVDTIDTRLVDIEAGIMDRGNGEFWRNDVHFEDNVKMVWCEVGHGDSFYYSEYLKSYGTDFMNMKNESVKCLMEFSELYCTPKKEGK